MSRRGSHGHSNRPSSLSKLHGYRRQEALAKLEGMPLPTGLLDAFAEVEKLARRKAQDGQSPRLSHPER